MKRTTWLSALLILAGTLMTLTAQELGTVPTDNVFTNRQRITFEQQSIETSNMGMTIEAGEPWNCVSSPAKSIWWSWQPPRNGMVVLDTESSSFDTVLGLFTGKTFAQLRANNPLCNDNDGSKITSIILANVFTTETYEIAVAGRAGSQEEGRVRLNLRLVTKPEVTRPQDQTIVVGQDAGFTASAIGYGASVPTIGGGAPPPLKYQWKLNRTNLVDRSSTVDDGTYIGGATTPKLTFNNTQDVHEGLITVEVTNEYGATESAPAKLTVGSGPVITQQPQDQQKRAGELASFQVSALGKNLTYRWQFKARASDVFVDLQASATFAGVNTTTLSITNVTPDLEGKYRVIVSSPVTTLESREASLTVERAGIRITQHPRDVTSGIAENVFFDVAAERTDGGPISELRIQWLRGAAVLTDGNQSFGRVSGATRNGNRTSRMEITTITAEASAQYIARISIVGTAGQIVATVDSLSATLTVIQKPLNDHFVDRTPIPFLELVQTNGHNFGATRESGEPFHAGRSPERSVWWGWGVPATCSLTTIDLNNSAFFKPNGDLGSGRLGVYEGSVVNALSAPRYKRNSSGGMTFFSTVAVPYAIAVDGLDGAMGNIQLNVSYMTNVPPPIIRRQCIDGVFLACEEGEFSIEVESLAPVTFQWQREQVVNGLTNYVNLPNNPQRYRTGIIPLAAPEATPELIFVKILNARPDDEGVYRILVESCAGSASSRGASLVLRQPPEIRGHPQDILNIRECSAVTFRVLPAGCEPTFQWRFNGVNLLNRTNQQLTFSTTTNEVGNYDVIVANQYGSVTSRVARLTVDPLPHIQTQPQGGVRRDCTNFTFTVRADDSCNRPLSYQWLFNGANLVRLGTLATASNLTLENLHPRDAGNYSVRISNVAGSITSQVATLVVNAGPWIRLANDQPQSKPRLKLGDSFDLNVIAESCTPLRYQWYFTGSTVGPLLTNTTTVQHISLQTVATEAIGIGGIKIPITNYFLLTNAPAPARLGLLPGETNPVLSVKNATTNHSGFYMLSLTNSYALSNSQLARVTVYVPPVNDHYSNRIVIPGTNAVVRGYNIHATAETNEKPHWGATPARQSVWWTWTAPDDAGFLHLNLNGTGFRNSLLALWTNGPLASLVKIAESSGSSSGQARLIDIGLTDRTIVDIAVDGLVSGGVTNEGNIQLELNYEIIRDPPIITRQPELLAAKKGSSVTFSVEHKRNPRIYFQWSFSPNPPVGTSNFVFQPIPGATNRTLTLTNIAEKNEGLYVVTLTNKYGLAKSESGRLTLGAFLRGMVIDATTKKPLPHVKVSAGDLISGSTNFQYTYTDENGEYKLFDLRPGKLRSDFYAEKRVVGLNEKVQFRDASTFSTITLLGTTNTHYNYLNNHVQVSEGGYVTNSFAMSPILLKGMRFVLNWGQRPSDLNLLLRTPLIDGKSWEIGRGDKGSATQPPFALLDADVTHGNGPETITIHEFRPGTYRLYVEKDSANVAGLLAESRAVLNIYTNQPSTSGGQSAIYEIHTPATGDGRYWYICDIDGASQTVTIVNQYVPIKLGSLPPAAEPLTGDPTSAVRKSNIALQAQTQGSIDYLWDFGESNKTSIVREPVVKYGGPGYKTVTLTVTDRRIDPPHVSLITKTNYILVTNAVPVVTLKAPANGLEFFIAAPITVLAEATDSDSPLAELKIFRDGELLAANINKASANHWPATTTWTPNTVGKFTFTAVGTDIHGASRTNGPITITVINNAPRIEFLSPSPEQIFRLGLPIPIVTRVQDVDTPLATVEFVDDTGRFRQTQKVPANTRDWQTTYEFKPEIEGVYTICAKATDIFGATNTTRACLTLNVKDLSGDVVIIHNSNFSASPSLKDTSSALSRIRPDLRDEIARMTNSLYEFKPGIWDPSGGERREYREMITRVLDQKWLTFDLISHFKLVIWQDLGELGLTDNDVHVFQQAYTNRIPLYFMGEKLISSSGGLSEGMRSVWFNFMQLGKERDAIGTNTVTMTTGIPPQRILGITWPYMTNIAYPRALEAGRLDGARAAVLASSGTGDVLTFRPNPYRPDRGDVRIVAQNFRVFHPNQAYTQPEELREGLYLYSVNWLVKAACGAIDLDLQAEGLAELFSRGAVEMEAMYRDRILTNRASTGTVLTNRFIIRHGGECEARGVVLLGRVPPNISDFSVDVRRDNMALDLSAEVTRTEDLMSIFLGDIENSKNVVITMTMKAHLPEDIRNTLQVFVNGPQVRPENDQFTIVTKVEGPPVCRPTILSIESLSTGGLQLKIGDVMSTCTYVLEVSDDLVRWTALKNLSSSGQSFIRFDLPVRPVPQFYRVLSPAR